MTKKIPEVGQGSLFVPAEFKAPGLPEGTEVNRITSISHLVKVLADNLDLSPDYCEDFPLEEAEPAIIRQALCLGTREARLDQTNNYYLGIGFSADQFTKIARSPGDLAKHIFSRTLVSNEQESDQGIDREYARETSSRSSIHALENYALKTSSLLDELSSQRICLRAIYKELKAPNLARYKTSNLDTLRRTASDIVHGHIEIASLTLGWGQEETNQIQRSVHYGLYGLSGHNTARLKNWSKYVLMSGVHTRNQILAGRWSLKRTNSVIKDLIV